METLKTLRIRAGLSQSELSNLTGTHQPHISAIEGGKFLPSFPMLCSLREALGTDFNTLCAAIEATSKFK